MTPSAGAATVPVGISGAPAPSGGTSGDQGKTPAADPKPGEQAPGKAAVHPKRTHTKTSGVSRRGRHHRVGTAVHHRVSKRTAASPAGAPNGTAGAPMAG
jgi:hypothetical protein